MDPTDPTTKAGACVAQEELEALGTSSRNTGILGQGEGLRHGYRKWVNLYDSMTHYDTMNNH